MATERGLPLPTFQRFDGKYPADWPQGVTLPAGYLLADPPLELDPAKNDAAQSAGYRLIDFEGLSPLGIEETITWFRGQFKQAGYTADRDALLETPPGSQEITWIVGKGSHELQFTGGPQPRIVNVMIKVWLDQDLGQFAYVMGSITVDTNR
ncbi:hypothetical protein JW859_01200 [bacterium]|nr:hypothetical protein [bacterium]